MLYDILVIFVFILFIITCFVYCYFSVVDYRENKMFRERVILLLSDIRNCFVCCGGDALEEGQD